jgi:hypothetical protein
MVSHYQGFGGVGDSGYGRYGGYEGFKSFSNRKGVLYKIPVPSAARSLTVAPVTDQKVNLARNILIFASLHNQSEVVKFMYLSGAAIISAVVAFYYYHYL